MANGIFGFLKSTRGVDSIDRDDVRGKDQLQLKLNYELLSRAGLSVSDVSRNLRLNLSYSFSDRGSNQSGLDYAENRVSLTISYGR